MTTTVTRSDPSRPPLDPERGLHDRPERAESSPARALLARVGAPLLAPRGVIQVVACRPQQPLAAGGFAGTADPIAHLVRTIGKPGGYFAGYAAFDRLAADTSAASTRAVTTMTKASAGASPAAKRTVSPPSTGTAASPRTSSTAKSSSTAKGSTKTSSTAKGSTKTSSTAKSSTKTSTTSTSTTSAKELAFLEDKNLSIEEKLYRFIVLMTKKGDQELVDAMKSYDQRRAEAAKASSAARAQASSHPSSGGGGGFLGSLVGGITGAVGSILKDAGGPLLAAATSAVGLPSLAPLARSAGGALGSIVAGAIGGGSRSSSASSSSAASSTAATASKTSSSGSTSASDTGAFDEKVEMLNLQMMSEKQTAMFTLLSNIIKSIHDTQMAAVQNIR